MSYKNIIENVQRKMMEYFEQNMTIEQSQVYTEQGLDIIVNDGRYFTFELSEG